VSEAGPWRLDGGPLGSLPGAGIDTIEVPPPPGWRYFALSPVWLMALMPDGLFAEGTGATTDEAKADARRRWRKWKRAHAGPLAVDGREYRRRLRDRRRRR